MGDLDRYATNYKCPWDLKSPQWWTKLREKVFPAIPMALRKIEFKKVSINQRNPMCLCYRKKHLIHAVFIHIMTIQTGVPLRITAYPPSLYFALISLIWNTLTDPKFSELGAMTSSKFSSITICRYWRHPTTRTYSKLSHDLSTLDCGIFI